MNGKALFITIFILTCGFLMISSALQAQTTWYVDDDAPGDPDPGDPATSDPLENGSAAHPFDAIQEGIDASSDGDTVMVLDGVYSSVGNMNMDFGGREITLVSESGYENCIIYLRREGTGFTFQNGETEYSQLDGFTINWGLGGTSGGGISCLNNSSPTIINCKIQDNETLSNGGGDLLFG